MHFQIRDDRNFTNSAVGQHDWFQLGVTFECIADESPNTPCFSAWRTRAAD